MCEFLSMVKGKTKTGKDKWYYLTYDLIHNTPRGELLQKKYGGTDLIGHSAIREYFGIREGQGENWECTDFSTPENFPALIVKAIKRGEFRGFGTPEGLLSLPAWVEHEKIKQQAWAEYEKIKQPALAEYEKIEQAAWAEYLKIQQAAWAEYEKIDQAAFWDLFALPENRSSQWR